MSHQNILLHARKLTKTRSLFVGWLLYRGREGGHFKNNYVLKKLNTHK